MTTNKEKEFKHMADFQTIIRLAKKKKKGQKLIVCVSIGENGVDFYLGVFDVIKNYVINGVNEKAFSKDVLLCCEGIPLERFLADSSSFFESNDFLRCESALNSMKSVTDKGNESFASSENVLIEIFERDNIASSLFIGYFHLLFRIEKHISAGNLLPESSEKTKERFGKLYDLFSKEFDLVGRNLMSPKDVREAGLKPQKAHKADGKQIYFCDTFSQLYADYIDFLRSRKMFFKKCASCGKLFYAENYRTKYDPECAQRRIKQNHKKSEDKVRSDAMWSQCEKERNNYNNFKRRRWYRNTSAKLQKEYDDLFERFKRELKDKKKVFSRILEGESIYFPEDWFVKIHSERIALENKMSENKIAIGDFES